jgi:hypothetical protein
MFYLYLKSLHNH